MSDKATKPAGPGPDRSHPPEEPGGHSETNRPGVTNGIPDALGQGSSTAHPTSDREQSEAAAGEQGGGEQGGSQQGAPDGQDPKP